MVGECEFWGKDVLGRPERKLLQNMGLSGRRTPRIAVLWHEAAVYDVLGVRMRVSLGSETNGVYSRSERKLLLKMDLGAWAGWKLLESGQKIHFSEVL